MSVQILHCGDIHLDKSFNISNLRRAFQRKKDLNDSFSKVVDYAVENKPDIFVLSGDVFDKIRPSNAARVFLTKQIRRLNDSNISVFMIGGNHEVPRLGTSPALAIDVIGSAGIATVFSSSDKIQSKKIKIGRKQVCVSGRSYCTKFEKTNPIKNIKVPLTGDYNILIIHGSLQGLNVSPSNPEMISQNPFSPDDIKKDLNYLALGHFHNYFKREHAGCCIVNPGSIERLSWAEINDSKGFVWAELGESKTSSEFVELDTRPMEIAELQLSKDEEYNPNIKDHIIDFLSKICDPQKILKLNLLGLLSQDQYGKLRANELLNACKDLFFNLQLNRRQLEVEGYGRVFLERIDNPVEAFKKRLDSLIAKNSQDDSERTLLEQVKSLGIKYLEMAK